jgi:hypothetical protein
MSVSSIKDLGTLPPEIGSALKLHLPNVLVELVWHYLGNIRAELAYGLTLMMLQKGSKEMTPEVCWKALQQAGPFTGLVERWTNLPLVSKELALHSFVTPKRAKAAFVDFSRVLRDLLASSKASVVPETILELEDFLDLLDMRSFISAALGVSFDPAFKKYKGSDARWRHDDKSARDLCFILQQHVSSRFNLLLGLRIDNPDHSILSRRWCESFPKLRNFEMSTPGGLICCPAGSLKFQELRTLYLDWGPCESRLPLDLYLLPHLQHIGLNESVPDHRNVLKKAPFNSYPRSGLSLELIEATWSDVDTDFNLPPPPSKDCVIS